MKQLARRLVYTGLRASGFLSLQRQLRVRGGRGWATILVFHSVGGAAPEDGTSITAARFRSILSLLRSEYRVLSLDEILVRLERRLPFTGKEVAITFDDGYLDNFVHAAPLLRELDLPACFFVTAGYIGTHDQFWWDREKGVTTELMSWPQVRELREQGFEIGCHTWSHPDLGREPIASWKHELLDARLLIEEKVGAPVRHFAYPYGGPANIRPEWIDAIRRAGFVSNFTASNDAVTLHADPYLIPRLGAAPQRSLAELRIDIDGAW